MFVLVPVLGTFVFFPLSMTHVLPAQTQELADQAYSLLIQAQEQGEIVHLTAITNKEVICEVAAFIDGFSIPQIVGNPAATTETLTKAENNFDEIQRNIAVISQKENDLNGLIQRILERQQQGSVESTNIKARITETVENLSSIEKQIMVTQENVIELQGEVQQLEADFENAQRQLNRARSRRKRWFVATVLTAGIASPGLLINERTIDDRRRVRNDRQEMLCNTQSQLQQLQASKAENEAEKEGLEVAETHLQFELTEVASIIDRLKSSLNDTVSYRMFLLYLSDAFKDIKVHVQHFLRNTQQLSAIQAQGIATNSGIEANLIESHRGLKESWVVANGNTALQNVQFVDDTTAVEATLTSIKETQLT